MPSGTRIGRVELVAGERVHEEVLSLDGVPTAVLCLSTNISSETLAEQDNLEDVVYQLPKRNNQLSSLRGAFIALAHMLRDITGAPVKNSTLVVGVELCHVAYHTEADKLLILCVPATRLSVSQLNCVMSDVVRLLRVLYTSVTNAFARQSHSTQLDELFSLMLERLLLSAELLKHGVRHSEFVESFTDSLPAVRAVYVPEQTKIAIDDCLSELEAADFTDMSEDYYGLRRGYSILGSCLFYQGYLISTHLAREDLCDAGLYLRAHGLLSPCPPSGGEQLGQVVVWREIFPSRQFCCPMERVVPGYAEPEVRTVLLVVSMRSAVLGVLLEAGGSAGSSGARPTSPDPLYIEQAKATLLKLDSSHLLDQCFVRLAGPPVPSLASIDWFLRSTDKLLSVSGIRRSLSALTGSGDVTQTDKKASEQQDTGGAKQGSSQRDAKGTKKKMGSNTSLAMLADNEDEGRVTVVDNCSLGGAPSEEGLLDHREALSSPSFLFNGPRSRHHNLSSLYDVSGVGGPLGEPALLEKGSLVKLSSGHDNSIFHYVHLDGSDGVFICPSQQELVQTFPQSPQGDRVLSPAQDQVLAQFHAAALCIRAVLLSAPPRQLEERRGKFSRDGWEGVREHGVRFKCSFRPDPKRSPSLAYYWVIGRMIEKPTPAEFYVCFHDSAHQNLVELAFKLVQGTRV